MKKALFLLFLFFGSTANAQGEASTWYFGQKAGLKFMPDGTVIPLSDGQLITNEGCSSISDINGNLLLYTDGKTVWDRNHVIMPNGINLFGDPSSTQSGIIVPKPNNTNIYYIFTVDEPHHENAAVYPNGFIGNYVDLNSLNVPDGDDGFNNGFNYSVVDLTVIGANGSIGDVVSKNNHLVTYDADPFGNQIRYKCSEKVTAVSNPSNNSFWIITHFINRFFAFEVEESGVSSTPVISAIGATIGVEGYRRNSIGYLKASPDGTKLAVAHAENGDLTGQFSFETGRIELFDFDVSTGVVSNARAVVTNTQPYGIEFSPSSEKLYATYRVGTEGNSELAQFDLFSNPIFDSKTVLFLSPSMLALQLAPNNKIYCATGSNLLGVINNPEENGLLSDYVHTGQPLAFNTLARLGLPPFITSFFFTPSIQLENACVGQNTSFQFNTTQIIISAAWNFGDGTTSSDLNPTHIYTTPGNYTVTVTVTGNNGVGISSREITIYPLPALITNNVNLKQCDDNNDGFSTFNLNESTVLLLNDSSGLTITFHPTLDAAEDNLAIIPNIINYNNQTINFQTVFARVENANGCYDTAQINLQVSTTSIPSSFQRVFAVCDDLVSGSLSDGIGTFDFSSANSEIEALFPVGQLLDITYYTNLADALSELNAITDISNYSNTDYPNSQNIYVRVDSQVNNECLGLGHRITLNVEQLPIVQPQILKECDDNQDGILGFDTSILEPTLLDGLTNVTVIYTDENGVLLSSPLPNPFNTSSQNVNVRVQNISGKQCDFTTTVSFIVDDLPEVFPVPTSLTSVCDDEVDPVLQDGIVPFDTSGFQAAILQGQIGMEVAYFDENNVAFSSPLPNPLVGGTQNIRVEIKNPLNPTCTAIQTFSLVVNPNPLIELTGDELICTDDLRFSRTIDAGLLDISLQNQYTYTWFLDGILLTGETEYTLKVTAEGVYEVLVENQLGCTTSRKIEVTASNAATIENIIVTDFSSNNSIEIIVAGLGEYVFSINDGPYQASNVFSQLESGIYTISIKDLKGCATVFETVYVLDVPKFFTPNGDGYNEFWNIKFLNPNLNLKVNIFDRYGKLLKRFDPKDNGWDGTYNGQAQPSTDYWFLIEFESGRNLRGHFTLKR